MTEIKWIGSPNFRKQVGIKKKFIVMHWIVGRVSAADAVFQNAARKVATQYAVGPNKIHQYVSDKDYAFGSGTTYANMYGISIEHEGGWMKEDGERQKPTKGTLDTSAYLCAKIAREHGMGKLELNKNVFPHKHFVATQCPGTLDMDYIIKAANNINGYDKPAPVAPVVEKPAAPVKPVAPAEEFVTVQRGDSYWRIATRSLGVKNTPANAAKIVAESSRIQKLNNNKSLNAGDKVRVK